MVLTAINHLRKLRPDVKILCEGNIATFRFYAGATYKAPVQEAARVLLSASRYLRFLRDYGTN